MNEYGGMWRDIRPIQSNYESETYFGGRMGNPWSLFLLRLWWGLTEGCGKPSKEQRQMMMMTMLNTKHITTHFIQRTTSKRKVFSTLLLLLLLLLLLIRLLLQQLSSFKRLHCYYTQCFK